MSKDGTTRLAILKGRTGLTPNILCRIGFCLSISEPGIPNPDVYDEDGQEYNRYTLTGEWDVLFMALLRERLVDDNLNPTLDLLPQFRAHLNRGVLSLFNRVKSLGDFYDLIEKPEVIGNPLETNRGDAA